VRAGGPAARCRAPGSQGACAGGEQLDTPPVPDRAILRP
jgi:hypothetical protein